MRRSHYWGRLGRGLAVGLLPLTAFTALWYFAFSFVYAAYFVAGFPPPAIPTRALALMWTVLQMATVVGCSYLGWSASERLRSVLWLAAFTGIFMTGTLLVSEWLPLL